MSGSSAALFQLPDGASVNNKPVLLDALCIKTLQENSRDTLDDLLSASEHLTGCERSPCWKGLNLISKTGDWLPAFFIFFFFQSHLLLRPISEHANSQARWNFPSTSSLWNIITVLILNSKRSAQARSPHSANTLTRLQPILKPATLRFGNDCEKWQVAFLASENRQQNAW